MAFNWNKFPWTNLHELNLDWIIQTVKTLENKVDELGATVAQTVTQLEYKVAEAIKVFTAQLPSQVQELVTNTLTGNGDLTINKTGDIEITSARSVTIHPVKIPDVVETGKYAANVEYVEMVVGDMTTRLDNDIDTERAERIADVAALEKRAPHVMYMVAMDSSQNSEVLTDEQITPIKTALLSHTPVMLCVDSSGDGAQFFYHLDTCTPAPDSNNINGSMSLLFKTVSGSHTATLNLSTKTIDFS